MTLKRLKHKCGGDLVIDLGTSPVEFRNEQTGAIETYEGVRCARCSEPLGLLADVREEVIYAN